MDQQDEILLGTDEDELDILCLNTDEFDSLLDDDYITTSASCKQHLKREEGLPLHSKPTHPAVSNADKPSSIRPLSSCQNSASVSPACRPSSISNPARKSVSTTLQKTLQHHQSESVSISKSLPHSGSIVGHSSVDSSGSSAPRKSKSAVTSVSSSLKHHCIPPLTAMDSSSQHQDDVCINVGGQYSEAPAPMSSSFQPHPSCSEKDADSLINFSQSSSSSGSSYVTSLSSKPQTKTPAKKLIYLNGSSRFSDAPRQLPTVSLPALAKKWCKAKPIQSTILDRCSVPGPTMFLDVSKDSFNKVHLGSKINRHNKYEQQTFFPNKKKRCYTPEKEGETYVDLYGSGQDNPDQESKRHKTAFCFDFDSHIYPCFELGVPLYLNWKHSTYSVEEQQPLIEVQQPPYLAIQRSPYPSMHQPQCPSPPYPSMHQPQCPSSSYPSVHHPQSPLYPSVHWFRYPAAAHRLLNQAIDQPSYPGMQQPTYPAFQHSFATVQRPDMHQPLYSVMNSREQWFSPDEPKDNWSEDEVPVDPPIHCYEPFSPSERPYKRCIEARSKSALEQRMCHKTFEERRVTITSGDHAAQGHIYLSRQVTFSSCLK